MAGGFGVAAGGGGGGADVAQAPAVSTTPPSRMATPSPRPLIRAASAR